MLSPDNSELIQSLKAFQNNRDNEHFMAVFNALQKEETFLVVPTTIDDKVKSNSWSTLEKGDTITFSTVFDMDGLKVFGVFTSPEKLMAWASDMKPYKMIPAKAVLEIAQEQGFGRIVIDSDQDTMFVLEKAAPNVKTEVIEEATEVLVWHPEAPIDGANKLQLQTAFTKISAIDEVFHFGMTKNNERVFTLAFVIKNHTENSRKAVINAINEGMQGYTLDFPLEVMYLTTEEDWYATAQKMIPFYKK